MAASTKAEKTHKVWIIYDGRFHHDPDSASIVEVCHSRREAKQSMRNHPSDYVVVETEVEAEDNVSRA